MFPAGPVKSFRKKLKTYAFSTCIWLHFIALLFNKEKTSLLDFNSFGKLRLFHVMHQNSVDAHIIFEKLL